MPETLAAEILERFRSLTNANGSEFVGAPRVTAAGFLEVCRASLRNEPAARNSK
jgi:hypothetical protein